MTFENFSEDDVLQIILDRKHQSRDWCFFWSKIMGFHYNFSPAVRNIFWAEEQPKRIFAAIGAREHFIFSKYHLLNIL